MIGQQYCNAPLLQRVGAVVLARSVAVVVTQQYRLIVDALQRDLSACVRVGGAIS